VDPVAVGPVGGPVLYEQLWAHVRHGLAVVGWLVFLGLVAAAGCWCCGYVVRPDLLRRRPSVRDLDEVDLTAVPSDAEIAAEAERGIRAIQQYLSTV